MSRCDLFVRGGGFSNKGDQAMGLVVKQELHRRLPEVNFWNRVPPDQTESAWRAGYFASSGPTSILQKSVSLARGLVRSSNAWRALSIDVLSAFEITQLATVDAVLDVGGFAYGDAWGVRPAKRALAWARYCDAEHKPFIAMPQAWGPFLNPRLRQIVKEIVERAALVYARDRQSLTYLRGLGGFAAENVRLAPDLVFKLRPAASELGADILETHGLLKDSRPVVAISPNMRVYERAPGDGYENEYVQLLIKVARFCSADLGASIALIAHERVDSSKMKPDDQFLCGLIQTALADSQHCAFLPVCDSPAQTMAILRHCELVVGSRYHVLVLSLATGVPVVSLGWAHKYEELLRDVGLKLFTISQGTWEWSSISSLLRKAWEQRSENRLLLVSMVEDIRGRVDAVLDEIAHCVSSSDPMDQRQ